MQVDGVFGYLAKATLNLDIVICHLQDSALWFYWCMNADFILTFHLTLQLSLNILSTWEKEMKNHQVFPKNQLSLKLPRKWGEVRLEIWQAFGSCFVWFQLPMPLWCWIKDLDLMVREYRPLWERQLPGKLGQPWGCSDRTRENQRWFISNYGIFKKALSWLIYLSKFIESS